MEAELGGMDPQSKEHGGLWAAIEAGGGWSRRSLSLRKEPALPTPGFGTCGLLNYETILGVMCQGSCRKQIH